MNALALSGFFMGITCGFLGILILRYTRSKLHVTFGLQNLGIALWGFGNGFAAISSSPENALFWWKIAHVGGFVLMAFLLHHVLLLNGFSPKKMLIFLYGWGISFPILCFSKLPVMDVRYIYNSYYFPTSLNIIYPAYMVSWLVAGAIITYFIVRAYKKSPDSEKTALRLYCFAYPLGMWGGGITFISLALFNINIFFPYGNYLTSTYSLIVTYTILRHRLLDIEVIIKKTLVFAGLLASVFAMLILPTLVIQEYIFRGTGVGGRMVGLAISGLIIMLALRQILKR